MKVGFEQRKSELEKYGHFVNSYALEYENKIEAESFLSQLGGGMSESNWSSSIESHMPKAFVATKEQGDDLPDDGIRITHNGNRFYHIASANSGHWCKEIDSEIIMLYEPVERLILFTFDWS
ncbi:MULTISPECIES: hypothetical protein [unclassified Acinetobacter]|uniref:hypothetical protein n=1 Tax=unclassified Acinetobacter TaxID=196816 RepID=UPI0035BB8D1E